MQNIRTLYIRTLSSIKKGSLSSKEFIYKKFFFYPEEGWDEG